MASTPNTRSRVRRIGSRRTNHFERLGHQGELPQRQRSLVLQPEIRQKLKIQRLPILRPVGDPLVLRISALLRRPKRTPPIIRVHQSVASATVESSFRSTNRCAVAMNISSHSSSDVSIETCHRWSLSVCTALAAAACCSRSSACAFTDHGIGSQSRHTWSGSSASQGPPRSPRPEHTHKKCRLHLRIIDVPSSLLKEQFSTLVRRTLGGPIRSGGRRD